MKRIIGMPLLVMAFFSSLVFGTVYENAENRNIEGWSVYDSSPEGANIANIKDKDKGRVIELNGAGTKNGYILGDWLGGDNLWNNRTEKTIRWSMKYDEDFVIYISVDTKKGQRYLYYTNNNSNDGQWKNYIHHGLGYNASYGKWRTFTRDLERDLQDLEPNNAIVAVNSFLVRGSGLLDDIELLPKRIYENAEDKSTSGWRVYDNNPRGATISNINDNTNSIIPLSLRGLMVSNNNTSNNDNDNSVIQLSGAGTKNGYILGDWIGGANEWRNTTEKIITWKMKYHEDFIVYVSVDTEEGQRYLYYTNTDRNDYGEWNNYIHHGVGAITSDGKWRTFARNLENDLKDLEPDNSIISVNAFLIRGSGLIDDIEMVQNFSMVNIEELNVGTVYLRRGRSKESSYHQMYIPSNVTHLEFDVQRTNQDCCIANDYLEIRIAGRKVFSYRMDNTDKSYVHKKVKIPAYLNGIYTTLTFRIINKKGRIVKSAVQIKNVSLKK
jgi:hypothetical protein